MSESEAQKPEVAPPAPEERQLELPAWVPAAIGLTLVLLAGMAVYTGFRTHVRPQGEEPVAEVAPFTDSDGFYLEESGGPPGAPGPGDSRVTPEGDVPSPGPLGEAGSPLAISGNADGVTGRKSIAVRRGLVFNVTPSNAVVYVNDVAVGSVRQFDSLESAYEFAEEGTFTVRIASPGYHELELEVSAGPDETVETATVEVRLEPIR